MVRRGHEPALLPRNGAGESFVSFIALFGGVARSSVRRRTITRSATRPPAPTILRRRELQVDAPVDAREHRVSQPPLQGYESLPPRAPVHAMVTPSDRLPSANVDGTL